MTMMITQADTMAGIRAGEDASRGVVQGAPAWLLRAEGAALLVGATWAYALTGQSWWVFAALLLAPDLLMLGYLRDPRWGAALYNAGHTTLVPLALLALGWAAGLPLMWAAGLIWAAHVGMDRAAGYGLKYARSFTATHLSAK
jgi:hypothetical protein